MKTGILLPRSTFHPVLQYDLLAGCQTYLKSCNAEIEIVTANIGFGTDTSTVQQHAEQLLLEQGVDVLIAYADQETMLQVANLARAANKLLIMVHPGARYLHPWEPHPNTISHTLHHQLCCKYTGAFAAQQTKAAAFTSSFFDAGFPISHSLMEGYTRAEGMIQYNYISKYKIAEFDISPLIDFLHNNPSVSSLLSLFNGDLAHHFLKLLSESKIPGLNIYAGPFMLDDALPAAYGALNLPFSLQGYTPWAAGIDLPANKLFLETCRKEINRNINSFTMLGWTTGQLLEFILRNASAHQFNPGAVISSLEMMHIDSPRGALQFDKDTHHTLAPIWFANTDQHLHVNVENAIDDILPSWNQLVEEVKGVVTAHWLNSYPCA
ncbi:ABC transporter substrate-binding protein [Chitinophaga sp. Hz27]|uniref:ABC transporter substrate-binding protein n=1 Tax=Chitinophaga sp. Hz27 TaxID=3347169 RepID=UPI0035DA8003